MSILSKLFGGKRPSMQERAAAEEKMYYEDRLKLALEAYQRGLEESKKGEDFNAALSFQRAIELSEGTFLNSMPPAGLAKYAWENAKVMYAQGAGARQMQKVKLATHCSACGRDLGKEWHYGFESLGFTRILGGICQICGKTFCRDDMKFKRDGLPKPCPICEGEMITLEAGAADSSMVDRARADGMYGRILREPKEIGRPVSGDER